MHRIENGEKKKSTMTQERIDLVKIKWKIDKWTEYYEAMKEYKEQNGNCVAPRYHEELGLCVK